MLNDIFGFFFLYFVLIVLKVILLCAKKIEIFDVRSAFRTNSLPGSGSSSGNNSLGRSLRNDLLVAADSVTNAMSTLVRELNSGTSSVRISGFITNIYIFSDVNADFYF